MDTDLDTFVKTDAITESQRGKDGPTEEPVRSDSVTVPMKQDPYPERSRVGISEVDLRLAPVYSHPRHQPSQEKLSTIRDDEANQCTQSLPCFLNTNDYSLEDDFDSLTISNAVAHPEPSYSSVPVLTQEQRMMFTQDEDGDTQLIIAADQSNEKATLYIISKAPHCAYLDLRNSELRTALHVTTMNSMCNCTARLLEKGASLQCEDFEGHTALHIAARKGDTTMLDVLCHYSTATGRKLSTSTLRKLLNTKDFEGYTCFHLVVHSGNAQAIQKMAKYGADVNARDGKSGRTALHHAVEGGNILLVKYLLKVIKVDVNETTYSGHSSLALARGRGFEDIAALISSYGGMEYDTDDEVDMELES